MNPLDLFLAWMRRRRASRIIAQAEHKRAVTMAQIAERRKKRREFVPLYQPLREATTASLRAYVEGQH